MAKTIGNPLSWGAEAVGAIGRSLSQAAGGMRGEVTAEPVVREITPADLRESLKLGLDDFLALRSDVIFLCLFYPLIGAALVFSAMNANLAPYIFPMASGFALLGPVLATGLYEMSKRREAGESVSFADAFAPFSAPNFGPILALGLYLLAVFLVWMVAAAIILRLTMGAGAAPTAAGFFSDVFTTGGGFALILVGTGVGAIFAAAVLALSVVSFPLLIDRNVGVPMAVRTSVEVTRRSPKTVALWGLIVAAGLAIGSAPLFLGLIVVVPVLGHATWHLFRRAVAPL